MNIVAQTVAVVAVLVCAVSGSLAQEKFRRVDQPARYFYPNTPIQVSLRMDGKRLLTGTDVKADQTGYKR